MYRYTVLFLFLFILSNNVNAKVKLDSLLNELDGVVHDRSEYAELKEKDISTLKHQLQIAGSNEQRFTLLKNLFELYANYQTDSAYVVVEQRIKLAEIINTPQALASAYMNLAEVYRTTGMYKETLEILNLVRSQNWDSFDPAYFYHLYHSLYMLMADYAVLNTDRKAYNKLLFNYKDTLLQTLNPDDMSYALVESSYYTMLGNYDKALDIALAAYAKFGQGSPLINYTLSEIYHYLGDIEKEKYYLALSAIEDLKSGVKEYISLHRLAEILSDQGDISRAYDYMKCAMEDAVFSNSRLRTLEVSEMLPLINKAYDTKMREQRSNLILVLTITLVLFVIVLISIYYIYKQMRQLSKARREQSLLNESLIQINEELKTVNLKLSESDHVKEEYISHLFNVCSSYISKLEDFRLLVKRNLQTGQAKQLSRMVDDNSLVADELREFYKQFDSIFLKIYPSFIKDFNELMTPEGIITPKEGDLLTPELRIFALVRLGINDSVKIAEFLHYSPQTIYNYRLKVRNKAKASKDEFLDEVIRIGQIK